MLFNNDRDLQRFANVFIEWIKEREDKKRNFNKNYDLLKKIANWRKLKNDIIIIIL